MQRTTTMMSYESARRRRGLFILATIFVLIVIAFIISVNTGYIRLTPLELLNTMLGKGTDKQELILFDFRLPRIVISLLIGAGLAVSGAVMQGVFRNDLADPGILGINAGAGLMVMLMVSFYPTTNAAPVFFLPVIAFVGAGLTAALIYVLAYKRHEGIKPIRLLLTGVAVAAGISAAMIVLTLRLDPDKYQFVATWLAGSIWGTSWKFVLSLLPWIVILVPYVIYKARVMNVLNLGEQTAVGLGANVNKEQFKLLAAAVGLAAASVAVSGGIGFVGLVGPHLARRLVGPKHQLMLPASALLGALLVITADTIGRWILQPSEIPTGIVVAVIGAPYFLYLLARTKS
ncbi:iron ABC transporter permease [Paenibacillus sp. FSL R7-0273]|uniref:FecCD family ABC transporter permease n=2 Tax=Paenibacillus sp. FSL R7-0273 TaxID=1536772 RepID=UPI0004F6ADA1|nr:iron ABC transporter permease [Paenibacillus sp. FSL R7-0273]AIQ48253.1 iron ABC transporter permease [Paenibacillus sp. FSL R7-0273]OMF92019.1 iron ABC transporter permease [Paenibacillus sp. FSL R7-0273]